MDNQKYSLFNHPLCSSSLVNFVRMVCRYGCAPSRLFRLAGVFLLCLTRQPVIVWEAVRFRIRIQKQALRPDPVFILGHWRSGTTHLQNLLCADPQFNHVSLTQAAMPLDFLSLGWMLRGPLSKSIPDERLMDSMKVTADCPWEEELALVSTSALSFYHVSLFPRGMDRVFRESILFSGNTPELVNEWKNKYLWFLKKISLNQEEKPLMLKNPANTARIQFLLQMFPESRYIHIHRDPYRVFASTVHLYLKAQEAWGFHPADREQIVQHVLRTYPLLMDAYLAQRELIPAGRLAEIRFAELQANPLETLARAYDQLGIPSFLDAKPHFQNYLSSVRNYRKNRLDLPERERNLVQKHWSRFFDKLGYER